MLQVTVMLAGAMIGQTYDVKVAKPRYVVKIVEVRAERIYGVAENLNTGQKVVFPSTGGDPDAQRIQRVERSLRLIAPRVGVPSGPFSVSVAPSPTADADQTAAGPWRWSDADVPEYMERYTPAKYTQEIAVTNGRDRITPVHRSRLKEKWRVPGGLAGIDGWASELWQWAPRNLWVGNIPVLNSYGHVQNNRGWKVSYEPGTEFLDVLRNTQSGEVFEVRKAMKTEKGWQRFVTYRNAAERPRGYHGPKGLNCHSCHDEAGSGGYATGLVPGGDTVLSMPFAALER